MKIERINPHGYCGGVKNAIRLAEAIESTKKIYMLGKIIHNDIVCNRFVEKGFIIKLNDKLEALDEIDDGVVVITAHGVSEEVIEKAKKKNLTIVDTTCGKVRVVHKKIKEKIIDYDVLYIGVKNHPECDAVLSINKRIQLIENLEQLESLDKNKKYYVTNQTTLSLFKLAKIYEYLENNFTNVVIDNKICLATTERQTALKNATGDCFIVIGDKMSSNTKELFNLANSKSTSYLVSNLEDVKKIDFSSYQDIKITSGASTPEDIFEEIYSYLITTYKSHLH